MIKPFAERPRIEQIGIYALLPVLVLFVTMIVTSDAPDGPDSMRTFVDGPIDMGNSYQYSVLIDRGATIDDLRAASEAFCRDKRSCQILGWTEEEDRAIIMPMLARESAEVVYSYRARRSTGEELLQRDCTIWPGEPTDCIN